MSRRKLSYAERVIDDVRRTPREFLAARMLERAVSASSSGSSVLVFTGATRPAAGVAWRGKKIIVKDAAQPSTVEVCVENSAGGYEWIIFGQSS